MTSPSTVTGHAPAAEHVPTIDPGSLFRFATAGSVDDGKSTLVGRLLHDAKAILADQLEAVGRTSAERGFGGGTGRLDLALLTDGLRAEREQGITIDVAYRYFATDRRSFILADCPGHVQYTKNTVTGASTADAVVLLVDARHGVVEQTRRHLAVVSLLRVPHVVVAVNKIDLVDYDQEVFDRVAADATGIAARLGVEDVHVVPVSALEGDNVVEPSARTPWYSGRPLLRVLEELPTVDESGRGTARPFRFPVQYVIRPQGGTAPGADAERLRDYRGYAGQIASGTVAVGDEVVVLPAGRRTTVTGIDIARGDLVASADDELPEPVRDLVASVAWLGERPLQPRARVLVKHGAATVQAMVVELEGRLDLEELVLRDATTLELNDIGRVRLRLASPLPVDPYDRLRRTGAFLVVDPATGNTLAAGLVRDA